MTITQAAVPEILVEPKMFGQTAEPNWARILSTGALITGAILLATGKRKVGLLVTAAGATAALLEDPESTKEIWNSIPAYIETSQQVLGRVERFVEDIVEQGDRVRNLLNRQA